LDQLDLTLLESLLLALLATFLHVLVSDRTWLDLRWKYLLDRHRKGLQGNCILADQAHFAKLTGGGASLTTG
jgi:hypothetical protein